jgi:hypothetical protein
MSQKRHPYGPATQSPCTTTPDRGLGQPPNKGQGVGLSPIRKIEGSPQLSFVLLLIRNYIPFQLQYLGQVKPPDPQNLLKISKIIKETIISCMPHGIPKQLSPYR